MTEGKPSAQDEKCKRTHDEARDLFDAENGRMEGQKKRKKKGKRNHQKKKKGQKREKGWAQVAGIVISYGVYLDVF